MSSVLLLSVLLLSPLFAAKQTQQNTFLGCVNQLADGTLQLQSVPSGELFALRGQDNVLQGHISQLIRVTGQVAAITNNNAHPVLTITQVQTLAGSCSSPLPTKSSERVAGKVGEDLVAVPVSSTLADDQTTPGFQTQATAVKKSHAEQPAAPARPEQVAESEAAANTNASSVERTEILPGHALGVIGSADDATSSGTGHGASRGR